MSNASSLLAKPTKAAMIPSVISGWQPPFAGRAPEADLNDQSMTATLLEPLNTLQTLSQTLFASLAPAQTKPPPPPSVFAFVAADNALAAAVARARAHQARQRRIEALKDEILELDERIGDVCAELEAGRRELEAMIVEGDARIVAIEQAKKVAAVPYPDLLAYAQTISSFTSAPPNMPELAPGQPPPPLFFPPFPNEEKMRRGRLNAEAPLGRPGETHSVGRPLTASPPRAMEAPLGYRHDIRPQQQFFDLDLDLNPDL